jgi:hypothetical protein
MMWEYVCGPLSKEVTDFDILSSVNWTFSIRYRRKNNMCLLCVAYVVCSSLYFFQEHISNHWYCSSVCDVYAHVHIMETTQQLWTVPLQPHPLGKTHMLAVETLLCYLRAFLGLGFAIIFSVNVLIHSWFVSYSVYLGIIQVSFALLVYCMDNVDIHKYTTVHTHTHRGILLRNS